VSDFSWHDGHAGSMLDFLLGTGHVTHSSLYTEQFLQAHTLTRRGLCTYFFYTKLHKDAFTHTNGFTQRGSYAQIDALRLNS